MASPALPLPTEQDNQEPQAGQLTPLVLPDGYVPGKYASFDVSPEPMFGPDELGEYKSAIDDLSETCTRADASARNFEVLQAWEQRWFERGYQFLLSKGGGLQLFGATSSSMAGGSILGTANARKAFPCNVFGARAAKFVAALSREVPNYTFVPKRDNDQMDQTAADEAKKYLQVWMTDAAIKEQFAKAALLFYTDDRVLLYTRSVADEQRWGTETPEEQQEAFDAPAADGVTPETELQPGQQDSEVPAVREITTVFGKLEHKVPIGTDEFSDMPWIRISTEQNSNTLKERYPWIEEKISAGGAGSKNGGGSDQLDRQARIAVRLAVQSSTSSGESWQQDATETLTWYRPSQYRSIKDKAVRQIFYDTFPKGLLVVTAGGELAFVRNESMNKHLALAHPGHGSGQNRRSVGSNYLPMQKILNADLGLIDRYIRSCVPQRYHDTEALSEGAIAQPSDPNGSIGVKLSAGQKISDITGVENVPTPSAALMEFVQWLIDGAPEAMDGMSPAMFGMEDADTYGATKLNRDQALQVLSMPYSQATMAFAKAAEQAVECAAQNRVASIRSNIPGQGKLEIELSNLQGNALCYPESMEIPQTIAEQEAQMGELLENSKNVGLYAAIVSDPRNLTHMAKFPSLSGLEIPGLDAVEEQQGEFELLMQSGPMPNPALLQPPYPQLQQQMAQIQQQLKEGQTHPEAQTPEGQQAMQQLQQQAQQIQQQLAQVPPQVSSVPVAQDGSQNHAVHAAIVLGMLNSAEGRKLKNGTSTPTEDGKPTQQAIFQNLHLHWEEHGQMSTKLTPPKQIEIKGNVTIDPTKLPPEAQAKAWQAIGLEVSPQELTDDSSLQPHEVTTEKEGVDAQGVPVKQKISMVGKQLR